MKFVKNIYPYFYQFNSTSKCKILPHVVKYRCFSAENLNLSERNIQIQTCGELYKQWRNEKLFKKIPDSNLTFNVKFIDTRPDCLNNTSRKLPTILALHGAPGSWKVYEMLISSLHQRGYRVIAPSFPDFHVCKPGIFRHTPSEKAQYIKDFLTAISVSYVDLLICHSGAALCGLSLCTDDELVIKSLALLNPISFNYKEMRGGRQLPYYKYFVKAAENPICFKFIENYGLFFLNNFIKVPVSYENVLDPLLSASTLVYGNIHQSKEKYLQVSKKLPILYAFSENDPLVSRKPSYDLSELFGAQPSDIFIYGNQGHLIQRGVATPALKVLAFQDGSHYVFCKYPEIINKEIAEFIKLQTQ